MCVIKASFSVCVGGWGRVVRVGLTAHSLARLVTCKADLRVNSFIYRNEIKIQLNKSKKLNLDQLESQCKSESEAEVTPLGCDTVAFIFTE